MTKRARFKISSSVFLLLIKEDRVLLLLRSNTGWMDGFYSVPAGALDGGETLTQAVCREAKEEIGVAIAESDLQLVHTLHANTGEEWIGNFFVSKNWTGEPTVIEPHKHGGLLWAPLNQLPNSLLPYVRNAIDGLQSGQSHSIYGWSHS